VHRDNTIGASTPHRWYCATGQVPFAPGRRSGPAFRAGVPGRRSGPALRRGCGRTATLTVSRTETCHPGGRCRRAHPARQGWPGRGRVARADDAADGGPSSDVGRAAAGRAAALAVAIPCRLMHGSGERTNDAIVAVIEAGVRGHPMHGTTRRTNDGPGSRLGSAIRELRWFVHAWQYSADSRAPAPRGARAGHPRRAEHSAA
jgi:hypothetical protein